MVSGPPFHLPSSTILVGRWYFPHASSKIPGGDLSLGHMPISNQSETWEMGIPCPFLEPYGLSLGGCFCLRQNAGQASRCTNVHLSL